MSKKLVMMMAPALVLLAAAAFFFLKPGAPAVSQDQLAKEPGPVYALTDPFVVNLADKSQPHLAKVGVALQVSKASAGLVPAAEGSKVVKMEQDAQIRDIVIAALQQHTAAQLATTEGRRAVKHEIMQQINQHTDVKIVDVYYTEFAVQ